MTTYRVLVTGSRDWTDLEAIRTAIMNACTFAAMEDPELTEFVVVHGDCPTGADALAQQVVDWWKEWGAKVEAERHPADWDGWGKAAGFRRNTEMAMSAPGICLAFLNPCSSPRCKRTDAHRSHGGTHCAGEAEKRDVRTVYYYE